MFNHPHVAATISPGRRHFVRWSLVALPVMLWLSGTPSAAVQTPARLPVFAERSVIADAAGNRVRLPVVAGGPGSAAPERPAPHGSPGIWTTLGPFGGDVTAAAFSPVDPNLAFAGIAPSGSFGGSLYSSSDGGATWSKVPPFAGKSVFDIEIAASGRIFVAAEDGVWTSENGGANWGRHDLGIGINQQVLDVELDPSNPLVVWAGVANALGSQTQVVMRSSDGGDFWVNRTPASLPGSLSCTAIAVRPGAPDTVVATFAGDFGGGAVWVTTNGGVGWTDRSSGLPANPMLAAEFAGTRLLVGGGRIFGSQFVGLYASDNLGVGWTPLHNGTWPLLAVTDVAVDPLSSNTLLVATEGQGINRTTNGGGNWSISVGGTAGLVAQSVRFRPASSTDVLVGASSLGVYRSQNGGTAFAQSSVGILELDLFSVHVNPVNPLQVAVAFQGLNNGGVFTSVNGGATWVLEPVPPSRYSSVRFSPSGVLYAISSGPSTVTPEGLYRRNPNGTWTGLGPDQGIHYESDLLALRFSESDPDLILLGGADFGFAGFEVTIWRSTDAGVQWTKEYEGAEDDFVQDIEIVGDGLDQVMVASYDGFNAPQEGGVLRSLDGGDSWGPALTGLPAFVRMPKMCAPPGDPQVFFLSAWTDFSTGKLFRTADGGASWTPTAWSGVPIMDVACDPFTAQALYIIQTGTTRVAASVDGGAIFTPYASGLESARTPRELAPAGTASSRLYLASQSGAYRTELASGLLADGFESGNTSAWSATVPVP